MSRFLKEREYYIFGEPMLTNAGSVRFLTYKEYLENIADLSIISMNSLHFYYQYTALLEKSNEENKEEAQKDIDLLKEAPLFEVVMSTENILDSYIRIFSLVLEDKDKMLEILTDEKAFLWYRELIMDMNMLTEQEVSKNPEIQKGIESSREVKSFNGESPSPTDIVSSVVAGTANSFKDVCNMSVIQVYSIFYRIGAFKNFDTSTLFATVSGDIKIESWSKNIDLYQRETSTIGKAEFEKKYGNIV